MLGQDKLIVEPRGPESGIGPKKIAGASPLTTLRNVSIQQQ